MDLFTFLKAPLSLSLNYGFFSPEALLRQCVYQKMRHELQALGGQWCFQVMEEGVSPAVLLNQLEQGGLFVQNQVYGLFFDTEDWFTSSRRKPLKALLTYQGDQRVMWVGAFAFNKLWEKIFPATLELIAPPLVQTAEDLKRLRIALLSFLPYPVSEAAWVMTWQRAGGDLTESFNLALQQTLTEGVGQDRETGIQTSKVDLFNLIKKFTSPHRSIAEIIEEFSLSLSGVSQWYPLLGWLYREATAQSRWPQKAWNQIMAVDDWVKHFVPQAEISHLTPFAIVLLHKAFQLSSIKK